MNINNNPNTKQTKNFTATIKYDRSHIMESLSKDKKLSSSDHNTISLLLDKIDTFSKRKENSIVEIKPRIDNGQVNLIGNVYNSTREIFSTVWQRSVRTLVKKAEYRKKYEQSVLKLIKNTEAIKNGVDKIINTTLHCKNIHGITLNGKQEPLTKENITKFYQDWQFQSFYLDKLNKGYNPTKEIIKLIKNIDKKSKNKNLYIGIEHHRKKNTVSYFTIAEENNQNARKILLSQLFRKPLDKQLIG